MKFLKDMFLWWTERCHLSYNIFTLCTALNVMEEQISWQ